MPVLRSHLRTGGRSVSDDRAIWKIEGSADQFEIAILETENALYRKENRRLKVEVAELRAALDKRSKPQA